MPSLNSVITQILHGIHEQEASAIGRTFAALKDYQLDGNKEMVALGAMNVVGSMTSCYVATGKYVHKRWIALK